MGLTASSAWIDARRAGEPYPDGSFVTCPACGFDQPPIYFNGDVCIDCACGISARPFIIEPHERPRPPKPAVTVRTTPAPTSKRPSTRKRKSRSAPPRRRRAAALT